jgi:membrane protein YqaA with SNARE-associated domain
VFKRFLRSRGEWLHGGVGFWAILALILTLVILSQIYREEVVEIGNALLAKSQKSDLYVLLFVLAAISSTVIPLPVWIYVYTAVALGFPCVECSIVIGLGSFVGSLSSYVLGRCFCNTTFFLRRFGQRNAGKWGERSRTICGFALFFGTVSPVPMDSLYVVSGIIRFPSLAFICLVSTARVARYLIMGYLFLVAR